MVVTCEESALEKRNTSGFTNALLLGPDLGGVGRQCLQLGSCAVSLASIP